jgi:hypothetical protein
VTPTGTTAGNPEICYSSDLELTGKALDLVRFDVDSLAQLVRAAYDRDPDVWLARPEGYQTSEHVLRDSDAIRLLAWCRKSGVLYATDGCNACRHRLPRDLGDIGEKDLRALAIETQIPYPMLLGLSERA